MVLSCMDLKRKYPESLFPPNYANLVIHNLHSANQGSTGMVSRALESVYWPGMDKNIHDHVRQCKQCQYSAPSQPKEQLILSEIPTYPFQHVITDLFDSHNHLYLAYADRLTGFIELAHFPTSTSSSVIIDTLREFFHRWVVPEEVSLDGRPNLVSREITDWFGSGESRFANHQHIMHSQMVEQNLQ